MEKRLIHYIVGDIGGEMSSNGAKFERKREEMSTQIDKKEIFYLQTTAASRVGAGAKK